jgi:hypothetical protein
MAPQEKAVELVNKYLQIYDGRVSFAKQCALIAVDEILNTLNMDIRDVDVRGNILLDLIDYWKQVKEEIEKL